MQDSGELFWGFIVVSDAAQSDINRNMAECARLKQLGVLNKLQTYFAVAKCFVNQNGWLSKVLMLSWLHRLHYCWNILLDFWKEQHLKHYYSSQL